MTNVVQLQPRIEKKKYGKLLEAHVATIKASIDELIGFYHDYQLDLLRAIISLADNSSSYKFLGLGFTVTADSLKIDFFSTLVEPETIFLTIETKFNVNVPVLDTNCETIIREWSDNYLNEYGDEIVFSFDLVHVILQYILNNHNTAIVEITPSTLKVIQGGYNDLSLNYITIDLSALVAEAAAIKVIAASHNGE
jgi:hypothetical protein